MKFGLTIVCTLFFWAEVLAQKVTANFSIPASSCINQEITLTNSSSNATRYEWDFCQGDLEKTPTATNLITLSGATYTIGVDFINVGDNWYGFFCNLNGHTIYRLDFGTDITKANPTVTDLGSFGGVVNTPQDIRILKDNDKYYALISGRGTNRLTRLTFGNSILNTATADAVVTGGATTNTGLDVAYDGSKWVAVITNDYTLTMVDFGNSLGNAVSAGQILNSSTIANANGIGDISLIKDGSTWYGTMVSFNNSKVLKANFGTSLYSDPTVTDVTNGIVSGSPYGIWTDFENGKYQSFICTISGSLFRYDFGASMSTTAPSGSNLTALSTLSNTLKIVGVRAKSRYYLFSSNWSSNQLYKVTFPQECSFDIDYSTLSQPTIKPTKSGTGSVRLYSYSSVDSVNTINKTTTIQNTTVPVIDFSTTNKCVSSANTFSVSVTSGDLTGYTHSWDFNGDNVEDSNVASPSYTFGSVGDKTVKLTVGNGTCSTSKSKVISIYNSPVAGFNTPTTNLCSNTALTFTNTSTFDAGSGVTWSWDFDGDGVEDSNQQSPSYTFSGAGTKTVTLKARLASGCESTVSNQVVLVSGPAVGFSWTNNCFGKAVNFSNTSAIGHTYSWDFGDGGSSTSFSPSHQYATAGTYIVKLTVNDGTCSSVLSKSIVVNDQPLASFTNGSAVENLSVSFSASDLTGSDDSVTGWSWDFGGLGTGSGQTSSHTFSTPNTYTVKLTVTTTQGCTSEVSKSVTVSQAKYATVDFSVSSSPVCLNMDLGLVNNTINGASYQWDLCQGDLGKTPTASTLLNLSSSGSNNVIGLDLIEVGGLWYGFVCSLGANTIFRLDFGSDINNASPTVTNLGSFGGVIASPQDIAIRKDGSSYYALVDGRGTNRLMRLNFGSTITNSSPAADVVITGGTTSNTGLDVAFDGSNWVAVVTNNTTLTMVNFGSSLGNTVETGEILNSSAIGTANGIGDISLIKEGSKWFGIMVTFNNSKVLKADFGTSLYADPTVTDVTNGIINTTVQPYGVWIAHENGKYMTFISTIQGNLIRYDFGASLTNNVPSGGDLTSLSTLSNALKISGVRSKSNYYLFTSNWSSNDVYKITFPQECLLDLDYSTDKNPKVISKTNGTASIKLYSYSSLGFESSQTKSITILNSQAPDLDFTTTNKCVSNANTFSIVNTSGDISSYSWDFNGDNVEDSNVANPSYTFGSVGTKAVSLTASNAAGCSETYTESIKIYAAPPATSFAISPSVYCTNNNLTFTNTTNESGYDGLLTYEWYLGGVLQSATKDVVMSFANAGDYKVDLRSLLTGCESAITEQTFSIKRSPIAAFSADIVCLGDVMAFVNSSQFASGYLWDFGDGSTSTDANPQHVYASPGDYVVSLQAQDVGLECPATIQKTVRVNNVAPTPDFEISAGAYCLGNELTFNNLTVESGYGNEVLYFWTITDFGNLTAKSPKLQFDISGSKTATLYTKYRNCTSALVTKTFEINPLPTVDFEATTVCETNPTDFTELTSGVTYQWDFGDGYSSIEANPNHLYETSGRYDVALTVVDANGCIASQSTEVLVNALPEADFTYQIACEGEQVVLQDLSIVDQSDVVSWEWHIGETIVSQEQNPEFTFSTTDKQIVTLIVESANGCQASYSEEIGALAGPDVAFDVELGCLGEVSALVDLSKTTGNVQNRSWIVNGNMLTSEESEVIYTFEQPGFHSIELLLEQTNSCSGSLIKSIFIPAPPQLAIEVSDACEQSELVATDLTVESSEDPVVSRKWLFLDEVIGNGPFAQLPTTSPGGYEVVLEVTTQSGCVFEIQRPIQINALPDPSFSVSSDYGIPPFTVLINTDSPSQNYNWLINGETYDTGANTQVTFTEEGDFVVQLVVESEFGCENQESQIVRSRLPKMDLAINQLQLVESNGSYSIISLVSNSSNIPVEQMQFYLSLENTFDLSETVTRFIEVGNEALIQLNTRLPVDSKAKFLCVSVVSAYPQTELTPANNEFCLTIVQETVLEPPFPNPAIDRTSVRMVIPEEGGVKVTLLDLSGQVKFEEIYPSKDAGLTVFDIDLYTVDPGTYFLIIDHAGGTYRSRIVKQ